MIDSLSALMLVAAAAEPDPRAALAPLDSIYRDLDALYIDLHQTPELSRQEEKTSAKMAERGWGRPPCSSGRRIGGVERW